MLVVDLAVLARQPEALTRVGESAFAYSVHTLVVDADPDVDGRVEAVRACLYFLSYLLALPLIPIGDVGEGLVGVLYRDELAKLG